MKISKKVCVIIVLMWCINGTQSKNLFYTATSGMRVQEYSPEGFLPTATDQAIFNVLKSDPLNSNACCLIVPWSILIHHGKLDLVSSIPHIKGPCFTICSHEYYRRILPTLKKIGVTHLFVTQAKREQYDQGIQILPVVYIPHVPHRVMPAVRKDYLYSFVGYSSHRVRRFIFDMYKKTKRPDVVVKERTAWGPTTDRKEKEHQRREYCNIIARSRFGLCPRGASPNTIRLLELMHAGAIPVVLADDLVLPEGIDWDSCLIRVPEKKVKQVDEIIRKIHPEQEALLRENGMRIARVLIDDPAYFIRYYFEHNQSVVS